MYVSTFAKNLKISHFVKLTLDAQSSYFDYQYYMFSNVKGDN